MSLEIRGEVWLEIWKKIWRKRRRRLKIKSQRTSKFSPWESEEEPAKETDI